MNPAELRIDLPLDDAWLDAAAAALAAPGDALVLRGEGRGGGLPLGREGFDAPAAVRRLAAWLDAVRSGPRPVLAAVRGPLVGGGAGLAAAADVVFAAPDARFQLPEVLFGLLPAAVLPAVAARVGWARARRLALGAAPLDAETARAWGLVDEVVADPDAAVAAERARLARAEPGAIAAVRRLSARGWEGAADVFTAQWEGPARARIARFAEGLAPWEDA